MNNQPKTVLPSFWLTTCFIIFVAVVGVFSLLSTGTGGILGAYYVYMAGPDIEKAYGFKLTDVRSGSDAVPRYIGFRDVIPTGAFGQAGINKGDLLANKAWTYHAVEKEELFHLFYSARAGQQVSIKVIAPQDTVGLSPLAWEASAKCRTVRITARKW